MKLNLRKANAIQTSIQETIKSIKLDPNIQINEFQDPEQTLNSSLTEFQKADSRRSLLLFALYTIRDLISNANSSSGVNAKLCRCAFIDKRLAQIEPLLTLSPIVPLDIINGKLDKIRNRKEAAYYSSSDTVATTILNNEAVDKYKEEHLLLKKQKQKLNDEILELNIKTEISIPEQVLTVLEQENLI